MDDYTPEGTKMGTIRENGLLIDTVLGDLRFP
jgi:hypothetical protein